MSIFKNILTFIFGCILAAILLEIGLRIFDPLELRLQGDRINLPRNVEYKLMDRNSEGNQIVIHRKNSLGFRGPELPEDQENRYIIFTVGGSTTEGSRINDGETWSALLSINLQSKFSGVWLNNAGLDGHSTHGHKLLLKEYILPIGPDMIMFLVGANDLHRDDLRNIDDAGIAINTNLFIAKIYFLANRLKTVNLALAGWRYYLASKQKLIYTQLDLSKAKLQPEDIDFDISHLQQAEKPYVEAYHGRIVELIDMSNQAGVTPVFMTQPLFYGCDTDPSSGIEFKKLSVTTLKLGLKSACYFSQRMELYNDALRRACHEYDVHLIDVARKMPHNSQLYYDYVHHNKLGQKELARIASENMLLYFEQRSEKTKITKLKPTNIE